MKIGVYYNSQKLTQENIIQIKKLITQKGGECVLFSDFKGIDGVDRLLILGGDGTILHAAQSVSVNQIPVVGVNYGTRGFLAEFEREETELAVDFIMSENPLKIERSMLQVDFNGQTWTCLNEISMLRYSESVEEQIVTVSLEIDNSPAGEFVADGLIVATPTGSTAYSLSAGGNILTPDCENFLLTPVCAFSLRSRPIVCSDKSTLSLSVKNGNSALVLHGDGVYLGKIKNGEMLTVKKSRLTTVFLTKDKSEFFRRLTKKIN